MDIVEGEAHFVHATHDHGMTGKEREKEGSRLGSLSHSLGGEVITQPSVCCMWSHSHALDALLLLHRGRKKKSEGWSREGWEGIDP